MQNSIQTKSFTDASGQSFVFGTTIKKDGRYTKSIIIPIPSADSPLIGLIVSFTVIGTSPITGKRYPDQDNIHVMGYIRAGEEEFVMQTAAEQRFFRHHGIVERPFDLGNISDDEKPILALVAGEQAAAACVNGQSLYQDVRAKLKDTFPEFLDKLAASALIGIDPVERKLFIDALESIIRLELQTADAPALLGGHRASKHRCALPPP
jgi:hypothetical protein